MEINIGNRKIPMTLTTFEMIAIEEEIGCTVGQIRDEVFGLEHNLETDEYTFRIVEDKEKLKKFGRLIRILGNAGLEEAGQEPDLTDKWVLRAIKPKDVMDVVNAIMNAFTEGMASEIPEPLKDGPVDVTLEEMKKKKETEA